MRVRIEPAGPEHMDQIQALEDEAFPSPWSRRSIEAGLSDPKTRFFTAVFESEDGRVDVAGYVLSWAVADELHLLKIAVRPDLRRKGIGRSLMDRAKADAVGLGLRIIHLEVREHNLAGQGFYQEMGFKRIGHRKGYYEDTGEDAILYFDLMRGGA